MLSRPSETIFLLLLLLLLLLFFLLLLLLLILLLLFILLLLLLLHLLLLLLLLLFFFLLLLPGLGFHLGLRMWLAPLKCSASMFLVLQKPVTQSATQWLVSDSLQAIDQEEQWEGELGTRWRRVL